MFHLNMQFQYQESRCKNECPALQTPGSQCPIPCPSPIASFLAQRQASAYHTWACTHGQGQPWAPIYSRLKGDEMWGLSYFAVACSER